MDWTLSLKDIDETQLKQALSQAHVPALMAALVHLKGSSEHLRSDIRPLVVQLADEEDGLTEALREKARGKALAALLEYRDAGFPQLPRLGESLVTETMHYVTGETIPDEQMELMQEELNLFGEEVGDDWANLDSQEQME